MKAHVVFPGQASQYVGMGKDLYERYGFVRELFEEASDRTGVDMARLCFEGPEEELKKTENTQPAIFTVSVASYRVLREEVGLEPVLSAGHSLGEYSALVASGVLEFGEAVSVLKKRGQFMQEAVPLGEGAMAAIIGLDLEKVKEVTEKVEGIVEVANVNGAGQVVISGQKGPVLEAARVLKEMGAKRAVELPVSAPFHCSLMKSAAEKLSPYLREMKVGDFQFPVVANLTASPYPGKDVVAEYLERQIYSPVRWEETMEYFMKGGEGIFLEVGPGKVLTGIARRVMKRWKVGSFGSLEDLERVRGLL
ncbi:MAG: [acyl-carrier-protein] S-malonyltransferase [Deltaproteobacteria bacterium]|nr:MAG: [acyl-carrier-protein] S-malonyltransferase [Deltaproteobacteria bacterium]